MKLLTMTPEEIKRCHRIVSARPWNAGKSLDQIHGYGCFGNWQDWMDQLADKSESGGWDEIDPSTRVMLYGVMCKIADPREDVA
jgi:hypothetical protein